MLPWHDLPLAFTVEKQPSQDGLTVNNSTTQVEMFCHKWELADTTNRKIKHQERDTAEDNLEEHDCVGRIEIFKVWHTFYDVKTA